MLRRSVQYMFEGRVEVDYFLDFIRKRRLTHSDIKGFESDRPQFHEKGFNPSPSVSIYDKENNHIGILWRNRKQVPTPDEYWLQIDNNTHSDQLLDITEEYRRLERKPKSQP